MKCRMLMGQLQKVDATVVIEPVIAGNKKGRWEQSSEETGADANDTSDKGIMRKKARK